MFLILGGWCLVAPGMAADLCLTPAWRAPDAPVAPMLIGCFGAQAMLGLCILGWRRTAAA
ncbi:MAG: hypothetical protein Q8L66_08030 [Caulobacter sp.]|nr:hypothetical protein [Caulobacter sp.]